MSLVIKPHFALLISGSIAIVFSSPANAQNLGNSTNILGQNLANNINVVSTAVPFLLIAPDARSNAMGDAGVASSPDANATHCNPAKLAFIKDTLGVSVSYIPWLRQMVPDINLAYLSWFYKLHNHQTIGGSLRYFSLGNIAFTGSNAVTIGNFNPNEYALDFTYSRQLSGHWSVAMSARYIYSNLTNAGLIQGVYTKPGKTCGVDISSYYRSREIGAFRSTFTFGACISNIGPKIRYSDTGQYYFIPTNLRLGGGYTIHLDQMNKVSLLLDFNKLLLPFIPAHINLNQEFDEITWSPGLEYTYDEQFSFRAGFFYENPNNGGRAYYTMGAGFKLKILTIDASYFIPVSQQNPLQNTLAISLGFYFD